MKLTRLIGAIVTYVLSSIIIFIFPAILISFLPGCTFISVLYFPLYLIIFLVGGLIGSGFIVFEAFDENYYLKN